MTLGTDQQALYWSLMYREVWDALREKKDEIQRLQGELSWLQDKWALLALEQRVEEAEARASEREYLRDQADLLADVMHHVAILDANWATALTARYEELMGVAE